MGSFDGAETCELVGCYLLSLLTDKYGQNIGLYRDDGLAAFNKTPQEFEKIKKELCKIFRENGLKITIEANKSIVNFLDVTLDLQAGKHFPYTKEGNLPLYVHKKSNHPPSILKNIPDAINKRLSEISSDRQCFDNSKAVYQEALNKSGYNYNLSYNESRNEKQQSRKNRPRNILWYNPPFSKNVKTNVGKCFLSLIDVLRSTSLLYKFLPTNLGACKPTFYTFLYITSEEKEYYETLFLSYRLRTKCSISQFFKINCIHSIFGTIEARVDF